MLGPSPPLEQFPGLRNPPLESTAPFSSSSDPPISPLRNSFMHLPGTRLTLVGTQLPWVARVAGTSARPTAPPGPAQAQARPSIHTYTPAISKTNPDPAAALCAPRPPLVQPPCSPTWTSSVPTSGFPAVAPAPTVSTQQPGHPRPLLQGSTARRAAHPSSVHSSLTGLLASTCEGHCLPGGPPA